MSEDRRPARRRAPSPVASSPVASSSDAPSGATKRRSKEAAPAAADRLAPRENVALSLATAAEVLGQLHDSLVRAGFSDGQQAYVKMSELLVGQRLWADEFAPRELDAEFGHVSTVAASIFSILQPYIEAMRRIAGVAPPDDASDRISDASAERVLERITERRGRTLSIATLMSETGMEREDVQKVLQVLVAEQKVTPHTSRGRVLYSLPRRSSPSAARAAGDSLEGRRR